MAAGTSIFSLMGEIFIDNDKANKSLQKTDGLAGKLAKGLGGGIKVAAKFGAAVTVAAVGAGTALFGMASSASEAADKIHKGSQRMGVSMKSYQEMEYWASQNGLAQEDLEKSLGRLNQRMGMAKAGNEKYAEALGKLGVNMEDVRAGTVSTEDAFATSIQTLSGMTNEQDKAALATEMFGVKLAREMLPALGETGLSLEDAKKKAEEFGLVLGDDAINAGVLFQDSLDDVKKSLGSVKNNIGLELLPMFQKMLEWVLSNMPEIKEVIRIVFKKIGEFVNVAIDIFKNFLIPIFVSIYDWTKENWPIIQAVIVGVFEAIKLVWENVLQPVLTLLWDTFQGIVKWIQDNWGTISAVIETVFNLIKGYWTYIALPIYTALWNMLKNIVKWVVDNWGTISNTFSTVFDAIKLVWNNVLKPVLDLFLGGITIIYDFIADNFGRMQTTVENTFSGIGTAVDAVTEIFGWLIDKVKSAWEWLTKWNDTEAKDKNPSYGGEGGGGGGVGGRGGGSIHDSSRSTGGGYLHSLGLSNVPYDNYPATLHKDEAVLTAKENKDYKQGKSGASYGNVYVTISAKDIIEMKNITDFFNKIGQVSKAGVEVG